MPVIRIVTPSNDLAAIATLVLAAIALGLALATVVLVLVTRAGTAQARANAKAESKVLDRQVGSGYRPLLVDVIRTAPVPPDMGALYDVTRGQGPNATIKEPGPVIDTKFPGHEPILFDPRIAFVWFEAGKIYVSVPLRNVGHGLAVIDNGGVEMTGPLFGTIEHRASQRDHVPVAETTRIDLVAVYLSQQATDPQPGSTLRGVRWQLAVPYCDFAGQQRTVARLEIVCHGDDVNGPWLVEGVEQESVAIPEPKSPGEGKGRLWRLLYGPDI